MLNPTSFLLLLLLIAIPAQPALAQLATFTTATVEGLEITQSIQSMGPCAPPLSFSIVIPCPPSNVPLIGGKPTVVRVYLTLSMSTPGAPIRIHGVLQGTVGAGTLATNSLPPHLDLRNSAVQSKYGTLQLSDKRKDISFSLNFLLPDPWIAEGALTLSTLNLTNDLGLSILCTNCQLTIPSFSFLASPTLRVRLIGVQYEDPGTQIADSAPSPTDYKLIKSWLGRAYPVATNKLFLDINSLNGVVKGFNNPAEVRNATCNTTLTHVQTVHGLETAGSGESDDITYTHFFGLRYDGGSSAPRFQSGCTNYLGPPLINYESFFFSNPGSSPTGPEGQPSLPWVETTTSGAQPWDTDGSYGDWYTGHELGHALGRVHVATSNNDPSSCLQQTNVDTDKYYTDGGYVPYLYPNGQLSPTMPYFVGLDVGDPSLGAPMKALPGEAWHDIMTYCVRQWISSVTYTAILSRLNEEGQQETLQRAAHGDTTPPSAPAGLRILRKRTNPLILTASGDLHERESLPTEETLDRMITDLSPSAPARQPAAKIVKGDLIVVLATVNLTKKTAVIDSIIRVESAAIPALPQERLVRIRLANTQGTVVEDQAVTVIPRHNGPSKYQVGTVRAVLPYASGKVTLDVLLSSQVIHTLRASKTAPKLGKIFAPVIEQAGALDGKLVFSWDEAKDDDNDKPTYSVQVRSNETEHWRTIALDLPHAKLALEPERFTGIRNIQIKVIASDGFHSSYVVSTWFTVPNVGTP